MREGGAYEKIQNPDFVFYELNIKFIKYDRLIKAFNDDCHVQKAPQVESVRGSIREDGFWWYRVLKVPAVEGMQPGERAWPQAGWLEPGGQGGVHLGHGRQVKF